MRISRNEFLIKSAKLMAERSTCNRLQVGCVFSKGGRIIASGYNGAPAGMKHCGPECNESTPCDNTAHAEANGIAWAARCGIALENASLFITHSPCPTCAKLIINAGIINVTYIEEYRLPDGINLLKAGFVGTKKWVWK